MVVDAFVRHWATVVTGKASGPEVFGGAFQTLSDLFHADGRILASPWLARLQAELDIFMGLFGHVGLQKTLVKRFL